MYYDNGQFLKDFVLLLEVIGRANGLDADEAMNVAGLFMCALAFEGLDREKALAKAENIYTDSRANYPELWKKTAKRKKRTKNLRKK